MLCVDNCHTTVQNAILEYFATTSCHSDQKLQSTCVLSKNTFIHKELAGVPGVAQDNQWRNQVEFFSHKTKKTE